MKPELIHQQGLGEQVGSSTVSRLAITTKLFTLQSIFNKAKSSPLLFRLLSFPRSLPTRIRQDHVAEMQKQEHEYPTFSSQAFKSPNKSGYV